MPQVPPLNLDEAYQLGELWPPSPEYPGTPDYNDQTNQHSAGDNTTSQAASGSGSGSGCIPITASGTHADLQGASTSMSSNLGSGNGSFGLRPCDWCDKPTGRWCDHCEDSYRCPDTGLHGKPLCSHHDNHYKFCRDCIRVARPAASTSEAFLAFRHLSSIQEARQAYIHFPTAHEALWDKLCDRKLNVHPAPSRKLSPTCGKTVTSLPKSSLITPPSYGEQKMTNPRSRLTAQVLTADLPGLMAACLNTPCSEYHATTCQVKWSFTSEAQTT